MFLACDRCKAPIKAEARFCSRCGDPILRTPEPALPPEKPAPQFATVPPVIGQTKAAQTRMPAVPHRARERGSVVLPFFLIMTVVAGMILVPRIMRHRIAACMPAAEQPSAIATVGEAPVQALYDLLRPSWNRISVGLSNGELSISGHPDDVSAVRDFMDLLDRGIGKTGRPASPSRGEEKPTRRTYRLSMIDANAMARALAFTDWNVRFVLDGTRLTVTAPPNDHRVIASMVKLLKRD